MLWCVPTVAECTASPKALPVANQATLLLADADGIAGSGGGGVGAASFGSECRPYVGELPGLVALGGLGAAVGQHGDSAALVVPQPATLASWGGLSRFSGHAVEPLRCPIGRLRCVPEALRP